MIFRRKIVLLGTAVLGLALSADALARPVHRNPYLSLANFTLNGRSNEAMYPREEIVLGLTAGNVGALPTVGGTLTIEAIQGPATALSGSIEFPALASGERAELRSGLRLRVNPMALASESVTVLLKWTTREGFTGSVSRDFRIVRGQLSVASVDFGNPTDPEAGGIQPGGEGDIYLTVANTGNERMQDIEATPTGVRGARAMSGAFRIASLDPGQSIRLPAPVRVAVPANCANGSAADVDLDGQYDGEVTTVPVKGLARFYAGVTVYYERTINFNPPVIIPVQGPAEVLGNFMVDAVGFFTDVAVTIGITHTYIGDLKVSIEHPDGTQAVLHDHAGANAQTLNQSYGMDGLALPDLARLRRKPSEGAWKLRVLDTCNSDYGQINSMKLRFRGYTTGN